MSSPNPSWKPGDAIHAPAGETLELDPTQISQKDAYKLLIGAVVPRPIAFVSTISAAGKGNLAPFSFFNAVSSNPPCVIIAISKNEDRDKKDTLRNIEETKQFVVNSANEWLIEPLVHCAATFPYGVDEMNVVGLTPEPSKKVKPARVKESAVSFECELFNSIQIGDGGPGSTTLVVGKVVYIHVSSSVYQNGRILFPEYKAIGRLGGSSYGKITEIFDIPVPQLGSKTGSGG